MKHSPRARSMQIGVRAGAVALIAALSLVWLSSWVPAQSPRDVALLTPREVRRLPEPAREEYEKAIKYLDHVMPILAIKHLDKASQLAPEAIDLHFLTARLAHLRGRMVFGAGESRSRDVAEDYYAIAESALDRVGKIENLTNLTQRRLETQLKMIQEERKKLNVRDQQRKAIGETFRMLYAKERYPEEVEEEEGEEKEQGKKKPAVRQRRPRRPPPRAAPRPRPRMRGADMES